MKKNIFITSISSKVPLIQTVIKSKDKFDKSIKIFGGDIDENVVGKYFVDKFIKMKKLSELTFNDVVNYCNKYKIKYIIPTRDDDVLFFSKIKQPLLNHDVFVFSAETKVVELCRDKLEFFHQNKKIVIPTFTNLDDIIEEMVVVKERIGSGSLGVSVNISKNNARNLAKTLENPIFQPYIGGKEYSVDSYVDKNGKCIASIVRSRDIVKNGEAQVTTYVQDKQIATFISEIVERMNITGHSILQLIKKYNKFYIIECNPRFGGASTLSFAMGLESFYWFFCEVNNKPIEFTLNDKKLKQIRFTKDLYIEC